MDRHPLLFGQYGNPPWILSSLFCPCSALFMASRRDQFCAGTVIWRAICQATPISTEQSISDGPLALPSAFSITASHRSANCAPRKNQDTEKARAAHRRLNELGHMLRRCDHVIVIRAEGPSANDTAMVTPDFEVFIFFNMSSGMQAESQKLALSSRWVCLNIVPLFGWF